MRGEIFEHAALLHFPAICMLKTMKPPICILVPVLALFAGCSTTARPPQRASTSAEHRERFITYWTNTLKPIARYDDFRKIPGVGHTVYLGRTGWKDGSWIALVAATPHERGFDGTRVARFDFNAVVVRDSHGQIRTSDYPFTSWDDLTDKFEAIPGPTLSAFYRNAAKYRLR